MSEKRFKSTIDEETMSIMPYLVSDKEEECFYNLEGCVDLLNKLVKDNEELGISIKLFEDDIATKDKKIEEQQATIQSLKEENEQLRQQLQDWDDMVELATKTSLRNVELDEQIGQLRKELDDCEKFRYSVFKRMGELNDE